MGLQIDVLKNFYLKKKNVRQQFGPITPDTSYIDMTRVFHRGVVRFHLGHHSVSRKVAVGIQ
jgi:hypothetical protein